MQDRQLEQSQAAQAAYIKSVSGASSGDVTSETAKAKGLLDRGAITQAESTSSRQRCTLPDFPALAAGWIVSASLTTDKLKPRQFA